MQTPRTSSLLLSLLLGCSAVNTSGGGAGDPDADPTAPTDAVAAMDAVAPRDVVTVVDRPTVTDRPSKSTDTGPALPDDPAARSAEAMCGRFRASSAAARSSVGWTPGAMSCDPGTLPDATRSAALEALNLFRWLAGLGPVAESAQRHDAAQACAVLLDRNGMLSHTPPMTWNCWSSLGYDGTSHSNLIGGRGINLTAWYAVSRLIDDRNDVTRTLGHRRWMLYPPLGDVGYGQTSAFACLYVLGGARGARARPWVAWPNPGPTPVETIPPSWSFSTQSLGWRDGVSAVTVTRDGAPVAVNATRRAPNYGDDTVSWDIPNVTAGSVYAVEISGISLGTVRYEVRPVNCM